MGVVLNRVDGQSRRIEIGQNARHIPVEAIPHGVGKRWLAVFCAEGKMNKVFR
jgi:hypothetical protein